MNLVFNYDIDRIQIITEKYRSYILILYELFHSLVSTIFHRLYMPCLHTIVFMELFFIFVCMLCIVVCLHVFNCMLSLSVQYCLLDMSAFNYCFVSHVCMPVLFVSLASYR